MSTAAETEAPRRETPVAGFTWQELCEDPRFAALRDLPFKVETNRWGQLIMSPTFQKHGFFQSEIAYLLRSLLGRAAVVVTECAVRTTDGVKVADVGCYSRERWATAKDAFDTPVAPEICVEVLSPSKARAEIEGKKALYFAAGAEEVWVCEDDGHLRFSNRDGESDRSPRAPGFPSHIEF